MQEKAITLVAVHTHTHTHTHGYFNGLKDIAKNINIEEAKSMCF